MANDQIPKLPVAVAAIAFVGAFIHTFPKFHASYSGNSLLITSVLAAAVALTLALVAGGLAGMALFFLKSFSKPKPIK